MRLTELQGDPQTPVVELVVAGAGTFRLVPGVPLVIGRDAAQCGVVVASGKLSRVHATVTLEVDGQVLVRDHGSANGTWVRGMRTAQAHIALEETFSFADIEARVVRTTPSNQDDALAVDARTLPTTEPHFSAILELEAPEPEVELTGLDDDDNDDASTMVVRLAGFLVVLMVGVALFFHLSGGKLETERDGLVAAESDLTLVRAEAKRLESVTKLVEAGELREVPVAICNTGTTPVTLFWLAGARAELGGLPGEPVLAAFNSRNCGWLEVVVEPGTRVTGSDLAALYPQCRDLVAQAYYVAVGIATPDGDWLVARVSGADDCIQVGGVT